MIEFKLLSEVNLLDPISPYDFANRQHLPPVCSNIYSADEAVETSGKKDDGIFPWSSRLPRGGNSLAASYEM
ncbi:hypothetical protein HDE79_003765 [Rhodanobacter sp. MP1X3]|nr:hypothetical protein [Rhodanobacter sp. MP1X3]